MQDCSFTPMHDEEGVEMTDLKPIKELEEFTDNPFWRDPRPGGDHTQVICPGCGEEVDIDGPLEDNHFVFAMRWNDERVLRMERSNLGTCPVEKGFDESVHRMRMYLGVPYVYYRGQRY